MLLHDCLRRTVSVTRPACAAVALVLAGCGEDELSEESTGSIDLVPFFTAGATAADPTLGLPRVIPASRGWSSGRRIEYYDFGAVSMPRLRGDRGQTLGTPDAAPVPPIYFFYDRQGRPLFSRPAYDARSGTWLMRGGKGVLDPQPIGTPAAEPAFSSYFSVPYLIRPRAELVDPGRGVADYQRPVIDVISGSEYFGLWEIVEVTVLDSEYELDGIKSAGLVQKGLDDGKLAATSTGKVINCPVVDERTQVQPSAMYNNIPRPRIEVWYRTKLGNCFLVNGWQALGQTADGPATDNNNLSLYYAGGGGFNTMDVVQQTVGIETDLKTVVAVPPAKQYVPTLSISRGDPSRAPDILRYPGDDLVVALPKVSGGDPEGYSPLVWMHDIRVAQDPPYQAGSFKDLAEVDESAIAAQAGTVTRNLAIIGAATPCKSNDDCSFGQQCNPFPDITIATTDPPSGQNIADVVIQREGGARCDVPVVNFGAYCAAGVTRCDVHTPVGSDNEKRLKDLGAAVAGPTFTLHADLKAAETKLKEAQAMSVDPALPEADRTKALESIAGLESTAAGLRTRVAAYVEKGFTTDFAGYGYLCYPGPAGGGAQNGSCQIRCNSGATGTVTQVESSLSIHAEADTPYKFNTEPRCGGSNMLGYRCLPTGTLPNRQRVCLRECQKRAEDPAVTLPFEQAVCDHPLNLSNKAFSFAPGWDSAQFTGQTCIGSPLTSSGASTTPRACIWNPDFYPYSSNVLPAQ